MVQLRRTPQSSEADLREQARVAGEHAARGYKRKIAAGGTGVQLARQSTIGREAEIVALHISGLMSTDTFRAERGRLGRIVDKRRSGWGLHGTM